MSSTWIHLPQVLLIHIILHILKSLARTNVIEDNAADRLTEEGRIICKLELELDIVFEVSH
jgi:hypothetical protein